jgi:hypothetical protein
MTPKKIEVKSPNFHPKPQHPPTDEVKQQQI